MVVADRDFAALAVQGFSSWSASPRHQRHRVLQATSLALSARRDEIARVIMREVSKPITLALQEVDRAAVTFSLAAEEARRFGGEALPLDIERRTEGHSALTLRVPKGPVLAISPFNFPLNLLAHKVAPALALGASVVAKPAPVAVETAMLLAQILRDAGLPANTLNIAAVDLATTQALVDDPRLAVVSFTGSTKVGWELRARAPKKTMLLELGGNAAAIVAPDAVATSEACAKVAERLAVAGCAYAGQVCIKTQRIYVHRSVWPTFVPALVKAVQAVRVGPLDDAATLVGPLINEAAAIRVDAWVEEALASGAKALLRGRRQGALLEPTVLTDTPHQSKVVCEEIFGPVIVVEPYDEFSEALAAVNDSPYGLQAGLFTWDMRLVHQAFGELAVGALLVNQTPTFRADNYAYGGVKDSGVGREGVRYAMEEMSDYKTLVMSF